MALTKKDIEHIANLARLELSQDDKERFPAQLSSILEYVSQVREVHTAGVQYHYTVEGLANVVDPDQIDACSDSTRASLLAAMPDRAGDLLKVKSVFQ